MKLYYGREGIAIWHGDCLEVMSLWADDDFDAIITDPPYGIAKNAKRRLHAYRTGTGKIGGNNWGESKEYGGTTWDDQPLTWEQWEEMQRVSRMQIVWGWRYLFDVLGPPGSLFAWDKKCKNDWWDYFSDGEFAYCSVVQPDRFYRQRWMGAIREGESEPRVHPTQKPIGLTEWCIRALKLQKNEVVLDPFLGSGSSLVACAKEGRCGTGIELEEEYCEIAAERVEAALDNL